MDTSDVISKLSEFVSKRDWDQFHSPENLAKSISIEAAELLECFQWDADFDEQAVQDELADVLIYCYLLSAKLSQNPSDLILKKIDKNETKYPVAKARGRSEKYDKL